MVWQDGWAVRLIIIEEIHQYMKTKMPFDGFFLKNLDEQNGTCKYEEYLRNCKENPLTEEERREWTESTRAAIAELEQLNAEPEPTRQKAEAEEISSSRTPEPAELRQEAEEAPEVEVVPAEAIVPLGQTGEDAPAEKEQWVYASELIGDAFQHWGNGRVLLDMGTGRGKSEFVIRKMAGWAVDQFLKGNYDNRILMICPLTLLHEDLEKRRRAEYLMVFGDDLEEGWDLYKEVLTVITYQKLEQLCTGDASDQRTLQELLDRHRIIIADECHYWSEFSAFNINTHYSLDALLQAEKDHTMVYMSATGRDTWKLLEEKGGPTQSERIYRLPQYYEYVKAAYFYARHNLVTILKRLPAGEKAIVFMELGDDLAEMEKIFGDTAAYYCSPFNERYRKKYSDLSVCVKDGQQLKDILFTTKAMGVGIGLKDRGVKHIFMCDTKSLKSTVWL